MRPSRSDFEPRIGFRRELHFQNNHHAASSVYLVNALMPSDRGISVVSQTRDTKQRDARIEYRVTPQWPKYVYWPVLGLGVGGWWIVKSRAKSRQTTTNHQPQTTNH